MAKLFENLLPTLFLCALTFYLLSGVEGSHGHKPRLFVFGDSYADTGNINKSLGGPWKVPYGITFPHRPSGRFSDGRVLTDFLAMFLGVKSPIPYSWRKLAPQKAREGVNFAFGGTGVLNTTATIKVGLPNMTTQIDLFQQILSGNDPSLTDAFAYVSLVGNDYNTYLSSGGSIQGLPSFITKVVNQLAVNLERLLSLGFRRIIVTGLQPIGCVPQLTASDSFKQCNSTFNSAVQFHNQLLAQAVATLNNQTSETPIHILDLYDSFFSSFQEKDTYTGAQSIHFTLS